MINQGSDIRQILQWEREMERQKNKLKQNKTKMEELNEGGS